MRLPRIAWFTFVFLTTGAVAGPASRPADLKPFTEQIPRSGVTFDMVPIPGGEFLLGSPQREPGRNEDEGPQVRVKVEPFYMGKFEVTQAEYDAFRGRYYDLGGRAPKVPADRLADAVTYPTPLYFYLGERLDRMGRGERFPAVFVSYYAARQYTKWLSKKTGRFYRLATEAEWEYACRAGSSTAYSFGDDPKPLGEYGWFADNSEVKGDNAYRAVGLKKPNAWGLYDMYGNVAELVAGQYDEELYGTLKQRADAAGGGVRADAVVVWPTKQYPRIARGGGFDSDAVDCRSAARHRLTAEVNLADPNVPRSAHWYSRGDWVGFRVVAPATPPDAAEQARYWDEVDAQTKKYFDARKDRQVREAFPPDPEREHR
jgi:formylglycine-generating enzyme required for sulfatase activity